jgi:hypothetical protein
MELTRGDDRSESSSRSDESKILAPPRIEFKDEREFADFFGRMRELCRWNGCIADTQPQKINRSEIMPLFCLLDTVRTQLILRVHERVSPFGRHLKCHHCLEPSGSFSPISFRRSGALSSGKS